MDQIGPTGAVLAIFLTGCASSPEPVASAPATAPTAEETASDPGVWETRMNGALIHRNSGGVCPLEIAGQKRFDTRSFAAGGRDVACQYESEDGQSILTLYFSDFGELTAKTHVNQAAKAVAQAKGLEINKDVSAKCHIALGLIEGTQAPAPGNQGAKVIEAPPCKMFSGAGRSSLLTVRTYGNWHFKVRLTTPDTGEDGESAAIEIASEILAIQDQAMEPASGGAGREA